MLFISPLILMNQQATAAYILTVSLAVFLIISFIKFKTYKKFSINTFLIILLSVMLTNGIARWRVKKEKSLSLVQKQVLL